MPKFIIEGGRPLNGTVRPSGNKNEALPALAACLLTEERVTLKRVPRIGDVLTICKILEELGATVGWEDDETLTVECKNIKTHKPPVDMCAKVRASILFLGPLLARMQKVELPLPGGDVIGARRIDTHWEGITALGAKLNFGTTISGRISGMPQGTEIFLDEPSVTGTENIVMLAALAQGKTTIHNAACEPHVVGICKLLNAMGAKITGIGTNKLEIAGVTKLHGATHTIGVDFMEVGSFACLGAIGRGKVTIEGVNRDDFRFIFKTLDKIGIEPVLEDTTLTIDGTRGLEMKKDVGGRVPSIYSGPWPAYPTDLMSVAIVAATQAEGTIIFFEKMFEGRMFFTDKLMAMGATIILCDPHRIVVNGPSPLYGARLHSPDVRAGMSLLMAGLVAFGKSEIENIYQIERGYANIEKKLLGLGAAIKRVD